MIYLDTSVALAALMAEDRKPPASLWAESVVSSRLLEYEIWTRIHARDAARSHGEAVRALLARVSLLDLAPEVLARAREPFPVAIRTLDALHLSSAVFLREAGQRIVLATYDARMRECALALGFEVRD